MTTDKFTSSVSIWRVVIIEDSPEDRDEIRRLLLRGSDRRYQFVEAETGAAGVHAILDPSNSRPDCVLLDFNLPDIDATDVLAAIIGSDELTVCPVVVLTGVAGPQFGPAILRSGAQDFIGKGWMTAESLTRSVETAVERWAMVRELQARKTAMEASAAQLQLVVEVAGLGVNRIDYLTNTVILDPLASALFGLEASVPLPRSVIHGTFHPDDKNEIVRLINLALDPGGDGGLVMEHRVLHRDGSIRWLSVTKQVVFGDIDGVRRPLTSVVAAVDINERKLAEETIARQALELDALYRTIPIGLFQFDADLRFVRVNAWAAAIHGRSIEAHMGRTLGEVLSPELANKINPLFRQILQTGEPVLDIELHGTMAANVDKRDWLANYYPVRSAAGDVVGVHGVIQDITQRKRQQRAVEDSQRTLHAIIERCPFGIYIIDADFRFASINARSETGVFANVRPIVGRPFDEAIRIIWPELVAAELIHIFRHTLNTGEPYFSTDFLNPRADTAETEGYEWELHRLTMPDGRPGVVCYYYDSTNLRRVEQELKDANRTKDEFLATLAHELRNPLAPIRNSLELLKWEGGNAVFLKQARETVERQIGHMVRLIDDLLDVSRISRNKLELKRERVELASVIHHAVETCQPHLDRDEHEFVLNLPPEPIHLHGDPTRLTQVIGNLLTNACKYSEPGTKISLSAERQEGKVKIVIHDQGIGIPPEMLDKVFDMFTQIDKSLERADGGLGIGLSLVKRLVELHGGTVNANSEGLGKGSEFTVLLPIEIELARSESLVQPTVASPSKSAGRRILVVDDNRDSATTLALLLQMSGNQIETAFDGLAAIEIAEAFRPHVILLDIGLPKMNGLDTCRAIRRQSWGKNILIIALTGWGQEEDRRKTAEAGFDNHLIKPVDPGALNKLLLEGKFNALS